MDKHIAVLERMIRNFHETGDRYPEEESALTAAIALMRGQSEPSAYLIRWKEDGLWRVSVRLRRETNASMREVTVTPLYEMQQQEPAE